MIRLRKSNYLFTFYLHFVFHPKMVLKVRKKIRNPYLFSKVQNLLIVLAVQPFSIYFFYEMKKLIASFSTVFKVNFCHMTIYEFCCNKTLALKQELLPICDN